MDRNNFICFSLIFTFLILIFSGCTAKQQPQPAPENLTKKATQTTQIKPDKPAAQLSAQAQQQVKQKFTPEEKQYNQVKQKISKEEKHINELSQQILIAGKKLVERQKQLDYYQNKHSNSEQNLKLINASFDDVSTKIANLKSKATLSEEEKKTLNDLTTKQNNMQTRRVKLESEMIATKKQIDSMNQDLAKVKQLIIGIEAKKEKIIKQRDENQLLSKKVKIAFYQKKSEEYKKIITNLDARKNTSITNKINFKSKVNVTQNQINELFNQNIDIISTGESDKEFLSFNVRVSTEKVRFREYMKKLSQLQSKYSYVQMMLAGMDFNIANISLDIADIKELGNEEKYTTRIADLNAKILRIEANKIEVEQNSKKLRQQISDFMKITKKQKRLIRNLSTNQEANIKFFELKRTLGFYQKKYLDYEQEIIDIEAKKRRFQYRLKVTEQEIKKLSGQV